MPCTDRSTELLVTGLVGILGTLFGALLAGVGSRALKWWDHRQELRRDLRKYRLLLTHTSSMTHISDQLKPLKVFLLENEELLERPGVKSFFDEWLMDDFLDKIGHSKFIHLNDDKNIPILHSSLAKLSW